MLVLAYFIVCADVMDGYFGDVGDVGDVGGSLLESIYGRIKVAVSLL